jgi:cytochrome c biogenesis protein CcdA
MGPWAWVILLIWSAALATAAQYTLFRTDRGPRDYDWVFIAGGALIGGFTAHVWYPGFGPVVDGLYLLQALGGGIVGGVIVELVYRLYIRPRQLAGRA